MRSIYFAIAVTGCLNCVGGGAYGQQVSPVPLKQMAIEGAFADKKAGAAATDISGMGCLPATATSRTRLLINDESAQFATIQNDRMIVRDAVLSHRRLHGWG